jgi:hypothetical protein
MICSSLTVTLEEAARLDQLAHHLMAEGRYQDAANLFAAVVAACQAAGHWDESVLAGCSHAQPS